MPVHADRIAGDIQAIAACTPTPGQGADRPTLSPSWRKARDYVMAEAGKRGLSAEIKQTKSLPAVGLSAKLADHIRGAAARLSLPKLPETTSGALHDAAILAPIIPTIMLFVSSKEGVSHNPGEFSRTEDMATATRLLYKTVRNC